ncbi:MAG TPA: hypothetical protein VGG06_11670 [Thermoanaerobaculia bacterium]
MLKLPIEPPRPLPARLRERLLAIPREAAVGCHDVDRLYAAARQRVHGSEADAAALGHLAACERCRTLFGVLDAAFRGAPLPLPRLLGARLRAIALPRLPLLARDVRLSAAACAMLAAMLLLVVGNPVALFRSTLDEAGTRAAELAEAGKERRQALTETLADEVARRYERGRAALRDGGRAYERFLDEARAYYENENWRQLLPSVTHEGEDNGHE